MIKLILIRHGQSQWNELNKYTGWQDVKLTKKGKIEAKNTALLLQKENFFFDLTYTSVLTRAIQTLWLILNKLDQVWLPVKKSWRLNERHYGALEGLNKNETITKYGEKQVFLWRRSFDVIPPQIKTTDKRFPAHDKRYAALQINEIPLGESLKMTAKRVTYFWKTRIFPQLKQNKKILIVAHGNSLRALIQYLYNINNQDILELNIPTATPIVLEFNDRMTPKQWYYLK